MSISKGLNIRTKIDLKEHSQIIKYTWDTFAQYAGFDCEYIDESPDIIIGGSENADIKISEIFLKNLSDKNYTHEDWFKEKPLLIAGDGQPDYLGTCFYMINCLQELGTEAKDKFGRFDYEISYQKKFDCVKENLVAGYFDKIIEGNKFLSSETGKITRKSKFFLSHDIDNIYGNTKLEAHHAAKCLNIGLLLQLMMNKILHNPTNLNINDILKLESEYQVRSTFYWMVVRGKARDGMRNSDYNFNSSHIQKAVSLIKGRGLEIGLHKAISDTSYSEELKILKNDARSNRNHFLKINLPDSFAKMEEANIEMDCSLGFAQTYGFRNSYGLPYHPFDMDAEKPLKLLEVPLHIMDATFYYYLKTRPEKATIDILDFLEKNKENTVISLLFHNNFLTKYKFKDYLQMYKSVLEYIHDGGFETLTPTDLIENF